MVNRIRASDPHRLNKGCGSKFHVGSQVWQETPEKGWKTHRSKCCEYNNKDEDKKKSSSFIFEIQTTKKKFCKNFIIFTKNFCLGIN